MATSKYTGGQGPFLLLDGATSTAEGRGVVFARPMSQFGFEVVAGSSNAQVELSGCVATSQGAPKARLLVIDFSSSGDSGVAQFITGTPVMQISATILAGASSGGLTARAVAAP